ncbi:non-specific serine/threonine protein kinase [Malassezia obtusa]|uniref:non-specific serine/threonine protein kinase n=1 Tax=Malassezia obtusa TaxID=76774 RepID=A0AAF0E312_9BASI|nr:non-specific serine/threonine protein kinase [Malassezia obtusa]
MSFLGSSTQRVNVYGRRGKTRVVPRDVENEVEAPLPPAPKPTGWGLFSGLDLRAWVDSPRKVLAQLTPRKDDVGKESRSGMMQCKEIPLTPGKGSASPLASSPLAHRVPLAPRDNAEPRAATPELPTEALQRLSLGESSDAMQGMLDATRQDAPHPFAECIQSMVGKGTVVKVGEASYSEVYRITRPLQGAKGRPSVSVMKVIPLEGDAVLPGPAQSPLASVEREIRVTAALSPRDGGAGQFVRLQEAHVVQGDYPEPLLAAWDDFKARDKRSENPRPDVLPETQRYALLCMDDAGTELEHTPLRSWRQRAAVFWQTAYALAEAEAASEFEHRDLHLGNILVTQAPPRRATRSSSAPTEPALRDLPASLWSLYEPRVAQVRATIIDYSLSRMRIDGAVCAYDFSDPTLFEGQGDTQYDVYRTMRSLVAGDWLAFHPSTNVLWLRFVAQRLLATEEPPEGTDTNEEAAYSSLLLAEQIADEAIEQLRRAAPQHSLSTRSKRRSIQRSPDAWKLRREARAPAVSSAAELVHSTAELLADGEK